MFFVDTGCLQNCFIFGFAFARRTGMGIKMALRGRRDCGKIVERRLPTRLRIAIENRIKRTNVRTARESKTLCIVCPVVLFRHPPTVCGTGFFGRERSLVRVFLWFLFFGVFWPGVRTQSEHYNRVRLQRTMSCVMKRKQKTHATLSLGRATDFAPKNILSIPLSVR